MQFPLQIRETWHKLPQSLSLQYMIKKEKILFKQTNTFLLKMNHCHIILYKSRYAYTSQNIRKLLISILNIVVVEIQEMSTPIY